VSTQLDTDWTTRAQRLADQLAENGDLQHPEWKRAVATVARHILVPTAFQQTNTGTWEWEEVDVTSPDGLDLVYSPVTLVTKLLDRGTYQEPISSSTKPDLIVRMLETLDPQDGDKALAVGTGSGYTTALLSRRLGDHRVFSVDVDQDLVDNARQRLAQLGIHPTLATTDGATGLPAHAPFNNIIATCSVKRVPWAWAEQLTPGGRVLADIKVGAVAGNLALLHRYPDRLEGRFTERWASFMSMRHEDDQHPARQPRSEESRERLTSTPPSPWFDNRVVWFLAQFHGLPEGVGNLGFQLDPETREPNAATMSALDGSYAAVSLNNTDGQYAVTEYGPTPLWEAVERAYETWVKHDRPDWSRLGLTVTQTTQRVWIDKPDSDAGWELASLPAS
jgi:protein-L-isoaspartate O-methyltransferase